MNRFLLSIHPSSDVRASVAGSGGAAVVEEKDYFQVTDELAKENSHFAISEALLAVIEQVYIYI